MWAAHPDVASAGGIIGAGELGIREPGPFRFKEVEVSNGNVNRLLLPGLVPDAEKSSAGFVRGEGGVALQQEFIQRAGGAGR